MAYRIKRLTLALVACTALIGGTVATEAASAAPQRGGTSTTCNASGTATITPGLTGVLKPQAISGKGKLKQCTGGVVTAGKMKAVLSSPSASCTEGDPATGTIVKWNTGAQSRASVSLERTAANEFEVTGTVTTGLFAGDAVGGTFTLTPTQGNCILTPVTEASFAGTFSA